MKRIKSVELSSRVPVRVNCGIVEAKPVFKPIVNDESSTSARQ